MHSFLITRRFWVWLHSSLQKIWTSNTCGCSHGKTNLIPNRHHRFSYNSWYLIVTFFYSLHCIQKSNLSVQSRKRYAHGANKIVSNKAIVSLANQVEPRIFCHCTVFYQFFSIDQFAIKMNYSELCFKECCAVNELEIILISDFPINLYQSLQLLSRSFPN